MTPKQERFVQEYCANGGNGTQAAIAAGYSEGTAYQIAHENLKKPEIQSAINEFMAKAAEKAGVNAYRILAELALVAFTDMGDYIRLDDDGKAYFDWSNLPKGATKVISEITQDVELVHGNEDGETTLSVRKTKFKLHDKLKALEKLGQHLNMFNDKGVTVNINPFDQLAQWMTERGRDKPGSVRAADGSTLPSRQSLPH